MHGDQAHPHIPQDLIKNIPGNKIPFVQPDNFGFVYDRLVTVLEQAVERSDYPIFVDGPSGGGKTRMAVELYREVRANMDSLNVRGLAYVCVDMAVVDKQGEDNGHAVAKIVAQLLNCYAEAPNNGPDALGLRPTLKTLVDSVFSVTIARAALFLHLDEFHKNEWATAALVVKVKDYNSSNLNRPILLVGSGLYTGHARLGLSSSGEREKLEVRFLRFNPSYELVRAAATAVREAAPKTDFSHLDRVLPQEVEKAPLAVRYLVEDTGGWALGCVQLGIELCLVSTSVKEALSKRHITPEALRDVEMAVSARLEDLYKLDMEAAVLGLSSAGFAKLVILALSPVSVRCISNCR